MLSLMLILLNTEFIKALILNNDFESLDFFIAHSFFFVCIRFLLFCSCFLFLSLLLLIFSLLWFFSRICCCYNLFRHLCFFGSPFSNGLVVMCFGSNLEFPDISIFFFGINSSFESVCKCSTCSKSKDTSTGNMEDNLVSFLF